MACYHPVLAFRSSNGAIDFTGFDDRTHKNYGLHNLRLPCGRCVGCRLSYSRVWATRIMHEASMHDKTCFITLTYSDDRCPTDRSLRYSHFQDFLKRLRYHYPDTKIRYFVAGEYGEEFSRPHFHACLFGVDFADGGLYRLSDNGGHVIYRSPILEKLWTDGYSSVGELTFQSAAYVARYVVKKRTGDMARDHYRVCDPDTGEIIDRIPEFAHMSLKPGIGAAWFQEFVSDCFPNDFVVVRGKKMKLPRYYDILFSRDDPESFEVIKARRVEDGRGRIADNTLSRHRVRETVAKARSTLYRRKL